MRIATDGSCLKNPGGKTGWAWVAETGQWQSGSLAEGSNNIGELMAAIAALRASRKVAEVHLEIDSQYVLNIIEKWGEGWRKRGWKKANGEPVANAKLVEKLLDLADRPGLTFEWVKGHNGHWLNEFADEQAGLAARNQTPPTRGRYTREQIEARILTATKERPKDRRTASGFKPPRDRRLSQPTDRPKFGTDPILERAADDFLRGKSAAKRKKSNPRTAGGRRKPRPKKG